MTVMMVIEKAGIAMMMDMVCIRTPVWRIVSVEMRSFLYAITKRAVRHAKTCSHGSCTVSQFRN